MAKPNVRRDGQVLGTDKAVQNREAAREEPPPDLMTPAMLRALQEMRDGDEELVCEGKSCWIGLRRISRTTVNALLRLIALRDVSDTKGIERYVINSSGLALIENPALADDIRGALEAGQPYTIHNGKLENIGDP